MSLEDDLKLIGNDTSNHKQLNDDLSILGINKKDESPLNSLSDNQKSFLSFMLNAGDDIIPGGIANITEKIYDKDAAKEIQGALDKLRASNKKTSAVGSALGFIENPLNKIIGGLGSKAVEAAGGNGLLKFFAKTAPGAAYVAGAPGEHSDLDYASGAAMNLLAHTNPGLALGVGLGSQALPAMIDNGQAPNYKESLLGALLGGGAAYLGGKSLPLNMRSAEALKMPLEKLEKTYLETGKEVPPEMRSVKESMYVSPSTARGKQQSTDFIKGINNEMVDLEVATNKDMSQTQKTAYKNLAQDIGELRNKTLSELQEPGNEHELDKVLNVVAEFNKHRGVSEDPMVTLNKEIDIRKNNLGENNTNGGDFTISNLILGRVRRTPYSTLKSFNKSFQDFNTTDYKPENIPKDVWELYHKTLQGQADVEAGRLGKTLRTGDAGEDQLVRYFDPNKPWKMYNKEEINAINEKEGVPLVYFGKNKPEVNTAAPEPTLNDLLADKNVKIPGNDDSSVKDVDVARLNELIQTLKDMNEGRREILRPKPSNLISSTLDLANAPSRIPKVGKFYDALKPSWFSTIDELARKENESRYAYEMGKTKEAGNMNSKASDLSDLVRDYFPEELAGQVGKASYLNNTKPETPSLGVLDYLSKKYNATKEDIAKWLLPTHQ